MFIPLSDDNPLKVIPFPVVTVGLIILNCVVFALSFVDMNSQFVADFAVVPEELFQARMWGTGQGGNGVAIPVPYTLVTYMFFHADIWHLAGNMVFLWVFGDNVEDAVGHVKFLFFYLACGIGAALLHAVIMAGTIDADVPLIGASGAVGGVIAAYLMLHPRVRVWVLALKLIPMRISAAIVLGAWVLTQVVMVMMPDMGPVAWWAHIGGMITGAVLIIFLRRPGVTLFDRHLSP